MKNKVIVTAIASIIILLLSCTDADKMDMEKSLADTKAKKSVHLAKSKKKDKKKTSLTSNKRKTQTSASEGTTDEGSVSSDAPEEDSRTLTIVANKMNDYAARNGFSEKYCFLVDMSIPSGRKRFFVYDMEEGAVAYSALVAHGSCNQTFLSRAKFSNTLNCGCSSLGKYKVGEFYRGQYGKSFRLYGLDNSNSNAFKRAVVIHGYDCVPDHEIYPQVLCNSLGCVMVSYNFFDRLSRIIQKSEKPILLWVYN